MDEYLPVALLHLREAEIVRLCGLARAARGQDAARTGRVHQAEREAGTLRATVLEGETTLAVMARFADDGLAEWACACSPQPDEAGETTAARVPCEHVAALLSLWVREPGQFRAAARPSDARSSTDSVASVASSDSVDAVDSVDSVDSSTSPSSSADLGASLKQAQPSLSAPSLADLEHLDQTTARFLNLLALAGGSVTESEARRLFTRLELGEPEAALPTLERLRQGGWAQPVFAAAPASRRAPTADSPAGWSIPDAALAWLPRVVPLAPLKETFGPAGQRVEGEARAAGGGAPRAPISEGLPPGAEVYEQQAAADLPALLMLMAALMVDRGAPAPAAAVSQPPDSRSTPDLDAALAGQWAARLAATPEQARFCLALLRLLGLLPQTTTTRASAQHAAPGSAPRNPPQPLAGALARPAFSSEQARAALLGSYRFLLARDGAEARRDVFARWLHERSARELVDLRDAGVRVAWLGQREARHSSDIAAENQAARAFIVHLLRWTPAGRWWSFSSLVEFVWRFQPAFLRGRQQTFLRPQWQLERLPDGEPLAMEVRAEWRQAEGRYIALLMRRPLRWLGAVDLALDAQGRLKGFRITPLGAFLLGAARDTAPVSAGESAAASAAFQLDEEGALLAPLAALQEETLERLLWWCEPAGATSKALRFQPGAERVAAALDAGQDLDAWLAWLETLPQSAALSALLARLRGWAALYGQARLYESATVLEVSDEALLRELEITLDLAGQFVDHPLAPGLALLHPGLDETLIEELRRRGYSAWITEDETPDGP